MPSQKIKFTNDKGIQLAGILDLPDDVPRAYAIFSHCFTCTKDLKAIVRISRGLAKHGIGVLRFDFTGLGESAGDFSETNFETNLADIQSAAHWLGSHYQPPQLLIGLSLGGAAMMASASRIPSATGLVTLAAPSCTKHLAEFLANEDPTIEHSGGGEVTIGGRSFPVKPQLLESLRNRELAEEIAAIKIHHLIIHSPNDETLGFHHAEEIFSMSGGVKTFLTLEGADHLIVNQPSDVGFIADQIDLWSRRFTST
jgi:putative redox protein